MADTLLDLITPPVQIPVDARHLPLDERFALWVQLNPTLVERITRLALAQAARGARRLSTKSLFEQVRASAVVAGPPADWKLDNSFTAPMARLLVQRHPELDGLFEFRVRRSA